MKIIKGKSGKLNYIINNIVKDKSTLILNLTNA